MTENIIKSTGQDVVCKNHNLRAEKEMYRICPAKLTKRELEDLYFALLENNIDLKKTINNQKDKLRLLSTNVQRMTAAQRSSLSKEQKECCMMTKAICNEQKELIADLKKKNEHLSERIKLLNMKLCSAKQFLQRNPLHSTSKCSKYSVANLTSLKHSSTSVLNPKKSDSNLISTAVSCQCLFKNKLENSTREAQTETIQKEIDILSTRSVQTEAEVNDNDRNAINKSCDENKCRTQMDELKQKIVNLQEELSKSHEEYSLRITKLESEVSHLRNENVRVRSERTASEQSLQQSQRAMDDMAERLRHAEAQYNDLSMQLSIERRKVVELETHVKAAQMSNSLLRTVEEHLNANDTKLALLKDKSLRESFKSPGPIDWDENSPRFVVTSTPGVEDYPCTEIEKDSTKISKYSDDSGYTEALNRSQVADDAFKTQVTKDGVINLKKPSTDQISSVDYLLTASKTKDVYDAYNDEAGCSKSFTDAGSPKISEEIKAGESPNNVTARLILEKTSNDGNDRKQDIDYRMQIPGPLPVDRRTSKKRISNVDKFIKNYYHRKNAENKELNDKKPYIQVNNENKPECKRDKNKNVQSSTEAHSDDQDSNSTLCPTIDLKYDEYIAKHKSRIDEQKPKTSGSVDGLCNINEITESIDTRELSITIDKVDINNAKNGFGVKCSIKDAGNCTEENSEWTIQDCRLQGDLKRSDSVNKNSKNGMKSDKSKCLSPNAESSIAGSKTKKINIDNNKEVEQRDDLNLRREQSSMIDAILMPSMRDECRKEMVNCGVQYESSEVHEVRELGTQINNKVLEQATRQKLKETSHGSPRTYTVQGVAEATEHDTDCEISSMTDLPSENEKSPRRSYSPGENKLSSTCTNSCTSSYSISEYKSLSEGELPGYRKASSNKLSYGEKPISGNHQESDGSIKMEEALKAVTEELARCKQLLLSKRPQDVNFLSRFS